MPEKEENGADGAVEYENPADDTFESDPAADPSAFESEMTDAHREESTAKKGLQRSKGASHVDEEELFSPDAMLADLELEEEVDLNCARVFLHFCQRWAAMSSVEKIGAFKKVRRSITARGRVSIRLFLEPLCSAVFRPFSSFSMPETSPRASHLGCT